MKIRLTLLIVAILLVGGTLFLLQRERLPEYRTDLSELASEPDWATLQPLRSSLSAAEFTEQLQRYFVVGDTWKEQLEVRPDGIYDQAQQERLYAFAPAQTPTRYWRSKEQLPARPAARPLQGIKITLDPGHIGGKFAKLEERWFRIGDSLPVMEGEMVLLVAQLIAPQLRALGAEVSFTRDENKPVTRQRTPHFQALAKAKVQTRGLDPALTNLYAEKLFYRTAEIRARAAMINKRLQPDLVVALHFNAEAWGDPATPTLTENNHFHILLNGAYTAGEVKRADQRYEMIRRILQGTLTEEIALSEHFVTSFRKHTALPPYRYEPNSTRAKPVDADGYVWTRNLLANRLYECPTIFLEPYVMNSQEVFDRVQLGDYEGTQLVNGEQKPSIFREYATSVVDALVSYYTAP